MEHRGQENDTGMPISINHSQTLLDRNNFSKQYSHQEPQRDQNSDSDPLVATAKTAQLLPPPPPQPITTSANHDTTTSSIRYRECLKNHAASLGGHVVDGCGEFMPSGEETPEALLCAACDCHRNFHRKEIEGESQMVWAVNPARNNGNSHRVHTQALPSLTAMPPQQQHNRYKYSHSYSADRAPPVMMTFGGGNTGAPAESSSEDLNMFHSNAEGQVIMQPSSFSVSKKRFRTKFTTDQKRKMQEFGEKLGWRIQKQDEQEVEQFCKEVGVKRQVFKVWMHNSKQAIKKTHP